MTSDLEQARELQQRLQAAMDALGKSGDFTVPIVDFRRFAVQERLRKEIANVDNMIERWKRKA